MYRLHSRVKALHKKSLIWLTYLRLLPGNHAHAQRVIANGVINIPPHKFGHPPLLHPKVCRPLECTVTVVTCGTTSTQNFSNFLQPFPNYKNPTYRYRWARLDYVRLGHVGFAHAQRVIVKGDINIPPRIFGHPSLLHAKVC
jgi:hypothetical protein